MNDKPRQTIEQWQEREAGMICGESLKACGALEEEKAPFAPHFRFFFFYNLHNLSRSIV